MLEHKCKQMLKLTAADLVGIGKIWAILVEFGKP